MVQIIADTEVSGDFKGKFAYLHQSKVPLYLSKELRDELLAKLSNFLQALPDNLEQFRQYTCLISEVDLDQLDQINNLQLIMLLAEFQIPFNWSSVKPKALHWLSKRNDDNLDKLLIFSGDLCDEAPENLHYAHPYLAIALNTQSLFQERCWVLQGKRQQQLQRLAKETPLLPETLCEQYNTFSSFIGNYHGVLITANGLSPEFLKKAMILLRSVKNCSEALLMPEESHSMWRQEFQGELDRIKQSKHQISSETDASIFSAKIKKHRAKVKEQLRKIKHYEDKYAADLNLLKVIKERVLDGATLLSTFIDTCSNIQYLAMRTYKGKLLYPQLHAFYQELFAGGLWPYFADRYEGYFNPYERYPHPDVPERDMVIAMSFPRVMSTNTFKAVLVGNLSQDGTQGVHHVINALPHITLSRKQDALESGVVLDIRKKSLQEWSIVSERQQITLVDSLEPHPKWLPIAGKTFDMRRVLREAQAGIVKPNWISGYKPPELMKLVGFDANKRELVFQKPSLHYVDEQALVNIQDVIRIKLDQSQAALEILMDENQVFAGALSGLDKEVSAQAEFRRLIIAVKHNWTTDKWAKFCDKRSLKHLVYSRSNKAAALDDLIEQMPRDSKPLCGRPIADLFLELLEVAATQRSQQLPGHTRMLGHVLKELNNNRAQYDFFFELIRPDSIRPLKKAISTNEVLHYLKSNSGLVRQAKQLGHEHYGSQTLFRHNRYRAKIS